MWTGYSAITFQQAPNIFGAALMGIRLSSKPRILLHADVVGSVPTTLTESDFDELAGRPGALFECSGSGWTLLDSNNFTWQSPDVDAGDPAITVDAASGIVDGVAAGAPIGFAYDESWCHPSYNPDSITVLFSDWQNETHDVAPAGTPISCEFRRANFNGISMVLPLAIETFTDGRHRRQFGNYGSLFFYSDAPITCGGFTTYPQNTIRWTMNCYVDAPLAGDTGATQIHLTIREDAAVIDGFGFGAGCYGYFTQDFTRFKYLSSFDQIDDFLNITHWIKKANNTVDNTHIASVIDGLTYWTNVNKYDLSSPGIGTLVRVLP